MIFVISMVDLVGIEVYIFIFDMMKFQNLRAFNSSSIQLLLTIPSASQYLLCASQSFLISIKQFNVENLQKYPSLCSIKNEID